MDTINANVIESAAEAIHKLDVAKLGAIHTVTLTLEGWHGGCLVTVLSENAGSITLVVK